MAEAEHPEPSTAEADAPGRALGPERRQERIAEIVLARGTVSAQELAAVEAAIEPLEKLLP